MAYAKSSSMQNRKGAEINWMINWRDPVVWEPASEINAHSQIKRKSRGTVWAIDSLYD